MQGNGGMSLLALKFVVEVILLYTPDPNGSSEPPASEGSCLLHGFAFQVHHCLRGSQFLFIYCFFYF